MAARRDGVERVWTRTRFDAAHRELTACLQPGDIWVGHNVHRFDRAAVADRNSDSPLLSLPTIDTLELSVLAFPERPYHALVKNDRLVRDATPDPLGDVRASEQVFQDALIALNKLPMEERDVLQALWARVPAADHTRRGTQALFEQLGWTWDPTAPLDITAAWASRACVNSPVLQSHAPDMALLMLSAWLRVADRGDGSALPAWVRRSWPSAVSLARSLRATSCHEPSCAWCTTKLSPAYWLQEVFGFPGFRAEPSTAEGDSLQRILVERGLRGESTFGILPTGGGKSLCFQVPAEARHRLLGQLTLVISPLQSLMKDQVDSLKQRIPHARAIYSGLPSLLRPQVIEEVRSGACGLLYVSPEQLRNASIVRLLGQRDLGAIVFDEAHCLSQWGHDFRTDYPYVLKVLAKSARERDQPAPPVFLFTATTQHDATQQILAHAREHTGHHIELLDGGSERDNLTYAVREVAAADRVDVISELLEEHLGHGTAIIFCGSRRRTEATASDLKGRGFDAIAYHAGLDADTRRSLQDAFLSGQHSVITATNAFGMGVDKPDVRLVVHLDMPSSLEAFLQEAGRAGRDRAPATAMLLWSPGDAEPRFMLGALGDLTPDDLRALWRAIRQLPASGGHGHETRVVTPKELLYQEALAGRFDTTDRHEETRLKAGVNWLERAQILERRENHTRVFSGRPIIPTLAEAGAEVQRLDLPTHKADQWRTILAAVYDAGDGGLSADDLAVLCRALTFEDPLEGGLRVLEILHQMAERRIISQGQTFSAFISIGVQDASMRRLERWTRWENAITELLAEEGEGDGGPVHLRPLADRLSTDDLVCTPSDLGVLLGTWAYATQGQLLPTGRVRFRRRGDMGYLNVDLGGVELAQALRLRRGIATACLQHLLDTPGAHTGKQVLVSGELENIIDAVSRDISFVGRLQSAADSVRAAIAWMHDLRVITVQNGLAVFRSAMRLDRETSWPTPASKEAAEALAAVKEHREHKVLRVHVMDGWARRMLEAPEEADAFRRDWFALPLVAFRERWFPRAQAQLARPTTPESYRAIVTDLRDKVQEAIVTRDPRRNHLVLAGPGSGKTRVLVHRIAWLLRCHRVRARQILVVCYTRANAVELRRRLIDLVGEDAQRVTIQTLHGVALTMVGIHRILSPDGDLTLETCIPEATRMLLGQRLDSGERTRQRDALLKGFHYLFIDEYQDIDACKYELLSALAGRAMGGDQRKLRVFAVGDDDQAIFAWDGASTDFIRRFEEDYGAVPFVIPHNYRNPAAVLEIAQALVEPLAGRLKADHSLTVDDARRDDPPCGPWATAHPDLLGHMVWHRAVSVGAAARYAMDRIRQWLDGGIEPERIGVLTPSRPEGLLRLRISAEMARVKFTWPLPGGATVPLGRTREVVRLMDLLSEGDDYVDGALLARELDQMGTGPWTRSLRRWLEPNRLRRLYRDRWRYDLITWARLERRARTIGHGVHLGTMHSAKGLEFDHVFVLDDGTLGRDPRRADEERRLLYVALTRARKSLQILSTEFPSGPFQFLSHPLLEVRKVPMRIPDAPRGHGYEILGPADIWLDWLGRQDPDHPGHAALGQAQHGDRFELVVRGDTVALEDSEGRRVAILSKQGTQRWLPRRPSGLRLRLLAVTREYAEAPGRQPRYRQMLKRETWWTGVWEGRWRTERQ